MSLRDLLKTFVIESVLSQNNDIGSKIETEEREALDAVTAAQDKLDRWLIAKQEFESWNKQSKSIRGPKPIFPLGTSERTSEKTLRGKLSDAMKKYASYEPSAEDFSYVAKEKKQPDDDDETGYEGILEWVPEVYANKWTKWPEALQSSNIKFGSGSQSKENKKEKSRYSEGGVGRGERWLAYLFGAKVMGQSKSYDLVMPDGSKYEVKELDAGSSTIRPGTKGIEAYEAARLDIAQVINEIQEFLNLVDLKTEDLKSILSKEDEKKIKYVQNFLNDEYSSFARGEISLERLKLLRNVLKIIKSLIDEHVGSKESLRSSIAIGDASFSVPEKIMIRIAKVLEKELGASIIKNVNVWSLVLSPLKSRAFEDYSGYFKTWQSKIKVASIFSGTDGLFIVNENKGFYWIPIGDIDNHLKFARISQGLPMLKFINFDE